MVKKQYKNILIGSASVLAVILLASCGKTSAAKETENGSNHVLRVIENAEVPTIDSTKSYDTVSGSVISKIQAGLYRINQENEVEPDLAETLPQISEDGKTYTVKLRQNLTFSDGSKIDATSFVYAIQRLFDPKTASQAAGSYYDILNAQEVNENKAPLKDLGVKALDDQTLEIELKDPNPTFSRTLSNVVLAPINETFLKDKGKNYAKTDQDILSSGPYILEKWDVNSLKWSYRKNPKYWNAKQVAIDKIEVNVVKDASTDINLFESGKIDYTTLSGDYIQKYKDHPGFRTVPINGVTSVEMGISSNPILQNKNVRQALFQSINREELVEKVLKDGSQPLFNPVPENLQSDPKSKQDFSELSDEKAPRYSTAEAGKAWAAAKKELDQDKIELELLVSDTEQSKKIGEYLQSQFETELPGLKIKVNVLPAKVRFQKMMEYKFDLAIGGWSGDVDPISYVQQFYSTYEHNHGKINDAALDKKIDLARTEYAVDEVQRFNALQDANQIITDQAYVIPLFQQSSTIVANPKLTNFEYKTGFDFTFAAFQK